jgi:hypothetical protein
LRSSFNILHVLVVVALCLEPCVFSFDPPMQRCTFKTRANLFPVRGCGVELPRTSKTRANLFPVRRCGAKLPSCLVTIATSGSLQAPASLGSLDCVALSLAPCTSFVVFSAHLPPLFVSISVPSNRLLLLLFVRCIHSLLRIASYRFLTFSSSSYPSVPPCDFFSSVSHCSALLYILVCARVLLTFRGYIELEVRGERMYECYQPGGCFPCDTFSLCIRNICVCSCVFCTQRVYGDVRSIRRMYDRVAR